MLHAGDYVFLIVLSVSIYLVSVRLVELLHGGSERNRSSHPGVPEANDVRGVEQ